MYQDESSSSTPGFIKVLIKTALFFGLVIVMINTGSYLQDTKCDIEGMMPIAGLSTFLYFLYAMVMYLSTWEEAPKEDIFDFFKNL